MGKDYKRIKLKNVLQDGELLGKVQRGEFEWPPLKKKKSLTKEEK